MLRLVAPLERQPPHDGLIAETGAHFIDRVFGLRGAAIDQVCGVCFGGIDN